MVTPSGGAVRRANASTPFRVVIRPDLETFSGMTSTRWRTAAHGAAGRTCSRLWRTFAHLRCRTIRLSNKGLRGPVSAAPRRRQRWSLAPRRAGPVRGAVIRRRAGGPERGTAGYSTMSTPYLRLQTADGKLVAEKPQKDGGPGRRLSSDSP